MHVYAIYTHTLGHIGMFTQQGSIGLTMQCRPVLPCPRDEAASERVMRNGEPTASLPFPSPAHTHRKASLSQAVWQLCSRQLKVQEWIGTTNSLAILLLSLEPRLQWACNVAFCF